MPKECLAKHAAYHGTRISAVIISPAGEIFFIANPLGVPFAHFSVECRGFGSMDRTSNPVVGSALSHKAIESSRGGTMIGRNNSDCFNGRGPCERPNDGLGNAPWDCDRSLPLMN